MGPGNEASPLLHIVCYAYAGIPSGVESVLFDGVESVLLAAIDTPGDALIRRQEIIMSY